MSIAMDLAVCQVLLEGDQGVVGVIKGLLLHQPLDHLYYCPTLTSVLRRVFYCKGNLTVLRR
jgi:hypothetical protein